MKVIYLQHLLIEYLEKHNFLKIVYANFIFADVKSIIQLLQQHFFADMKEFELERLNPNHQQGFVKQKMLLSIMLHNKATVDR